MMCIDSLRNYILCLLLLYYYIIQEFCCYSILTAFIIMVCIDSLENYIFCLLLLFYYIIQEFCCYSILTAFIIMMCMDFLECYILFVNNNSKKKKIKLRRLFKVCRVFQRMFLFTPGSAEDSSPFTCRAHCATIF